MAHPRPDHAKRAVEITALNTGTTCMVQIRAHKADGVSLWITIGSAHRAN